MTSSRYCVIFANGDLNDGEAVRAVLDQVAATPDPLIIAADGGARHALTVGLTPHMVIGDFDSLSEAELADLQARGSVIQRHPTHKDETDLELTLIEAVAQHGSPIRVIGGVGDRLDQTFGNVYLMALPAVRDVDVRMVAGKQTIWLVYPGTVVVSGQPGDTLSLLPVGGHVTGIVTNGLEYALRGETLAFGPARGVSNVLLGTSAQIQFESGVLLLIHTIGRA
jgi:thiamine pyrophosphokinase